jgi:peptide/nickel transport system substrate-binding protein
MIQKEGIMRFFHLYKTSSVRVPLLALMILFTFCGAQADAASEPGTIIIVIMTEPLNLDPGNTNIGVNGQVLTRNVLESLTVKDPADSSIMPGLATSWKQLDATTWHFFLRKGVKFHNGEDFNADVVAFNIKRLYDKRIQSQNRDKFFSGFKMESKVLDSHTLEIKTDKPQPLLPTFMGFMTLCSSKTPVDKWTNNPIGTGPYRFVKWDAGAQIVLERFDGYWGTQPPVKKAVYLWRTESSVRAAMVLIGEADLTPEIAVQNANRPDMDQSYLNSETMWFRIGGAWEPPLNYRRVRMALNYAIDRDAIRGTIFSKDVMPATHLIPPNILGYNPDLKVWPYDPKKARQLLDEARKDGVPVDKEITMVGRIGWFSSDELMEVMMTMYKAVGLNVKVKIVEAGVWRYQYNVKPFPTNVGPHMVQRVHDNNSGDAAFSSYTYRCDGSNSVVCDKEVEDLMERATAATGEERRKLWQAAFKRIYDEIIPDVPLFHMIGYARVGKRINFRPSLATTIEIPIAQITFNSK